MCSRYLCHCVSECTQDAHCTEADADISHTSCFFFGRPSLPMLLRRLRSGVASTRFRSAAIPSAVRSQPSTHSWRWQTSRTMTRVGSCSSTTSKSTRLELLKCVTKRKLLWLNPDSGARAYLCAAVLYLIAAVRCAVSDDCAF